MYARQCTSTSVVIRTRITGTVLQFASTDDCHCRCQCVCVELNCRLVAEINAAGAARVDGGAASKGEVAFQRCVSLDYERR